MAQILLVVEDRGEAAGCESALRSAGHRVLTALTGQQGLHLLRRHAVDLVLVGVRLRDMPRFQILRYLRSRIPRVPLIVITGSDKTQDALVATRFGAVDVLDAPVSPDGLLRAVGGALAAREEDDRMHAHADERRGGGARRERDRAHAIARWARVVAPIVDAPCDPRTISGWSRLAFVSPDALSDWCRTAGIPPRRALVFARLLRAVVLAHGSSRRLENLLDVVDRRTLAGLLRLAGLSPETAFPADIDAFLQRQALVRDPDALCAIRRALATRHRQPLPITAGPP